MGRRMTQLDRRQFTQKITAAELDKVSIVRGEWPSSQQAVNGFAGANEIRGLFTNLRHGGFSLRTGRQGVREGHVA